MSESIAGRDPIEMLADSFLARFRRGERPSVDEYAMQHPELADEIRELLPALVMLEQEKPVGAAAAGTNGWPAAAAGPSTRQLGDYLILREIGRGGMGVVYESVQQSLGRHVALKVLPIQALVDSSQVERFRMEARAAARLHHTNIVPVFGVGESDGVHYYAMQFIQGQGLDVVIDALRELRAGIAPVTVARGESSGVVGGDDRPPTASVTQALLTGRFAAAQPEPGPATTTTERNGPHASPAAQDRLADRAGDSFPSDSGVSSALASTQAGAAYFRSVAGIGVQVAEALAYAHGQGILHRDIKPSNLLLDGKGTVWVTDFGLAKADGSDGPTQTGDIVGTLRYMAPERFDGWSDPRSDVYALGATLYELLTSRPPFRESDRVKLMEQVLNQNPAPPRKLDGRIPRDLETIVLKALAKEPGDRYATARELADELQRFLEYRPVRARRPSLGDRAAKWSRRHKAVVVAVAGSTFLFLILTVVVLGVSNLQIHAEEERTAQQRERAEANLRTAREVVDRMFTRVAQDLAHTPRMEKVRRALLVDALEFYQGFLQENGTNPTLRYEAALAFIKVGDIHGILGQHDHAEEAWRQAIALLERLSTQFPQVPEYRENLAYCFGELGLGLTRRGRLQQGIAERRKEVDLMEKLASDFPTVPDYRRKLAIAHTDLGNAVSPAERFQEAEYHHRRALTHWEKLRADFPQVPEDRKGLAHIHHWWGHVLLMTHRLAEAEQEFRNVLAIRERLVADEPGNRDLKSQLAHIQDYLGQVLLQSMKPGEEILNQRLVGEAEEHVRRSVHLYETLVEDFPDSPDYRRRLVYVYSLLSHALMGMGRVEEAMGALRRSLSEEEKLIAYSAHRVDYRIGGGWGYHQLGSWLQAKGSVQEAADAFREAKDRFEKQIADNPRVPGALRDLASFLTTCPATQFRDVQRAITLAKQALQMAPLVSNSWYTLGRAEYQAGHWAAAIEALEKSAKLGFVLDPGLMFFLAIAHGKLGHKPDALNWYDQGARLMDARGSRDEELGRQRALAAALLGLPQPAGPAKNKVPGPAKH
jgi:tetratricopeptide (TPR) repeat protein